MTSGLDESLSFKYDAQPGSSWFYNTKGIQPAYIYVLERVTSNQDIHDTFISEWLFDVIRNERYLIGRKEKRFWWIF